MQFYNTDQTSATHFDYSFADTNNSAVCHAELCANSSIYLLSLLFSLLLLLLRISELCSMSSNIVRANGSYDMLP